MAGRDRGKMTNSPRASGLCSGLCHACTRVSHTSGTRLQPTSLHTCAHSPQAHLKDPLFNPSPTPRVRFAAGLCYTWPGSLGPPIHSLRRPPWASACVGPPGSDPQSCIDWLYHAPAIPRKHGSTSHSPCDPWVTSQASPPSVNGVLILRPPREGGDTRPACLVPGLVP